jgi:hypothetical protein
MRLSWYADTGVAVFSIWQGGMCTGTFRLPITDLSRMIEILQRGPHSGYHGETGGRGGPDYADPDHAGPGHAGEYPGDYGADYGEDPAYGQGYSHGQHGDDYRSGRYRADDYAHGDFGSGEYGSGEYGSGDYHAGDYAAGDHEADLGHGAGQYRTGQHEEADYGGAGYGRTRQELSPHPQAWPDSDGRYQPDITGEHHDAAGAAGYGQQRFVPPYVRGQRESSATGYSADSDYRLPADPGAGSRHSAGRHSSGQEQ